MVPCGLALTSPQQAHRRDPIGAVVHQHLSGASDAFRPASSSPRSATAHRLCPAERGERLLGNCGIPAVQRRSERLPASVLGTLDRADLADRLMHGYSREQPAAQSRRPISELVQCLRAQLLRHLVRDAPRRIRPAGTAPRTPMLGREPVARAAEPTARRRPHLASSPVHCAAARSRSAYSVGAAHGQAQRVVRQHDRGGVASALGGARGGRRGNCASTVASWSCSASARCNACRSGSPVAVAIARWSSRTSPMPDAVTRDLAEQWMRDPHTVALQLRAPRVERVVERIDPDDRDDLTEGRLAGERDGQQCGPRARRQQTNALLEQRLDATRQRYLARSLRAPAASSGEHAPIRARTAGCRR